MRFDQTMNKLNNMSDLEETFVPDLNRIKFIESAVEVVDSKVNTCLIKSKKLDETLQKLDQLSAKTSLLEPEIERIKLIEKSVDSAENKLNKCLDESLKLDLTLAKLEALNARMIAIEPELSKINTIELTMDKFDVKQNNLISILIDAINRKKAPTPSPLSSQDSEFNQDIAENQPKTSGTKSILISKDDEAINLSDSKHTKDEHMKTGIRDKLKIFGEAANKSKLPVLKPKPKDEEKETKKEEKKDTDRSSDWSKLFAGRK